MSLIWNVQMITSHLIVLPSKEEPSDNIKNRIGLHRDGGTSYREMQEPHPRIMLKIAYAISDQSDPASGATVVVPGSNRLTGRPATDPETGWARGAISMNINAGDAFLFEQRTWHGIGHNWSGLPRKTIFMGYALSLGETDGFTLRCLMNWSLNATRFRNSSSVLSAIRSATIYRKTKMSHCGHCLMPRLS